MGNSQSCEEPVDGQVINNCQEPNQIALVIGCKSKEETQIIVTAICQERCDPLKSSKTLIKSTISGNDKQNIVIDSISGNYQQLKGEIQVRAKEDILVMFLVLSQADQIILDQKKEIIQQFQQNHRQAEIHLIVYMGENDWTGEEQVSEIRKTYANIGPVIQLKQNVDTKDFEPIFKNICRSYFQSLENSQASNKSKKNK